MVTPAKGAILGYKPEPPPSDLPASAQRYLDTELHRIAAAVQGLLAVIASTSTLRLTPMAAEPASPADGVLIYTDGTTWDPGSGQGYYYWNGMAWTPLG